MKNKLGFTLLELIVVVVIVIIIVAIAIPSYKSYVRKAFTSQAQQEMQKLSLQLERHRFRNFSYQGFDASYIYLNNSGQVISNFNATKQQLTFPLTGSSQYILNIVDGSTGHPLLTAQNALGQKWSIKAISLDSNNYTLLMTSDGIRCKNKTSANVDYDSCGTKGSEDW